MGVCRHRTGLSKSALHIQGVCVTLLQSVSSHAGGDGVQAELKAKLWSGSSARRVHWLKSDTSTSVSCHSLLSRFAICFLTISVNVLR